MDKYFSEFTIVIGGVGGFIANYLGGWDLLLRCLVLGIIIDYATGLLKAIYNKQLSSEIGFKGIVKKVMALLVVAFSCLINQSVGIDTPIREIVITFLLANEGISIIENAIAVGLPLPKKMKDVLIQLRGESGNDENTTR